MIPTASLAAVLVYVGIRLVKPSDVKKLARFGKVPVMIYVVCLLTIVLTNLLTGGLVGIGLSLLKLLYTVTHLDARIVEEDGLTHIHLSGVGTFLGIPKITSALDQVKSDGVVHLHSHGLRYIDHACIEVRNGLSEWKKRGSVCMLRWRSCT
jgi:MFS superfamily sulfate permease-like transporter